LFHSWYLPEPTFPLWPCVVLLVVFIPVSIWHERNWRRTLAAYAQVRASAGATDEEWPSADLARAMGVQLWLVLFVTILLALGVAIAVWAALQWPHKPLGFDQPINPLDLPDLWSFVVAGSAAVIAGVAVALDVGRSPWVGVARKVRRAIYVSPEERARLFALALAVDPGIPHPERALESDPAQRDGADSRADAP
jgi:hypothetical protein